MEDVGRLRTPPPWPWALAVLAVVIVGLGGLHVLEQRHDAAKEGAVAAQVVVRQIEALAGDDGGRAVATDTERAVAVAALDQAVRATRAAFGELRRSTSGADVDRLSVIVAESAALLRRPADATLARLMGAKALEGYDVARGIVARQRAEVRSIRRQTAAGQGSIVVVVGALVLMVLLAAKRAFEAEATRHTAHLVELAHLDPLTGIANRRSLSRDAPCVERRNDAQVLVLDLDGFKDLNDRLGHDAGDRLLVDVARSLADDLDGTVYRTGGDEFCIVAPDGDGDLASQAERLVRAVAPEGVTASVGVARLPHEADGLLAALKLADARMYAAKLSRRTGRPADAGGHPIPRPGFAQA
ncbi:GGDEF domain-containing protein [Patulibacter americanus]|uniref:GGDEF domain-containing protein n=1 Tax=Patulibacter americanus TaxID=588672 RepID=UPI0003B41D09|nr:GGDEF domain-containing protein [Patulibacter americanus]